MKTQVFTNDLSGAAEILRNGGLVAVPTETVYGLAGNGLDAEAVQQIYEVKGRPTVKPLSLMVHGSDAMERYCLDIPPQAYTLAKKFWPGPLTIVLKARPEIPEVVLAGGSTVGLRCPDHPMTLRLLELTQLPFAAPSANPSGEPSPKDAATVVRYFDGKIDGIVDGGHCGIGRESTLISLAQTPYKILREAALDETTIADALVDAMTIVGITGGSGSGKTTALHVLKDMGAAVLDCDAIYHEMLRSDKALLAELREHFPAAFCGDTLERPKLAAEVFSSSEKLQTLNAVTHKHIARRVQELLREHAMRGGTLAAVDAIELLTSGLGKRCSFTVAVLAEREVRIGRIMARDGISRERAEARIGAQHSDDYFVSQCTHTLYNNADEESFRAACQTFFTKEINNHG